MDLWSLLLLTAVGVIAGALNVVAGGGSFLTLPVLIFLGLPPSIANGTNRVAIVLQNVGATWSFRRHAVLDLRALLWAALPSTVGAVFGTLLSLRIPETAFQQILAGLMVVVSLWTLFGSNPERREELHKGWLAAGFFAVGVYGGFVQAGVGFLVLAATSLAGLDLVRGNAVKVLAILCFSIVSLSIFVAQGKVWWVPGLALAVGNTVGGLWGVRLTVLKGDRWIRRVVTAAVIVFAVRLFWTAT